ncbi:hypothetical protein ACGVWS_06210 [Enterobacteriaceae bacterium LUAb1]
MPFTLWGILAVFRHIGYRPELNGEAGWNFDCESLKDMEIARGQRLDGKTPPKGLVQKVPGWLHHTSSNDTCVSHRVVPLNYQRLLNRIDGSISPYLPHEYLSAIHNPSYRDAQNRMSVKHPSEWYHRKSYPVWLTFLNNLTKDAPEWKTCSEAYIEKMVWMQDASKLSLGPSFWHMHPVASAGVRKGKNMSRSKTEYERDADGSIKRDAKGRKIHKRRYAQAEGVSYYSGDGINKAHISPAEMVKVLGDSKNGK